MGIWPFYRAKDITIVQQKSNSHREPISLLFHAHNQGVLIHFQSSHIKHYLYVITELYHFNDKNVKIHEKKFINLVT